MLQAHSYTRYPPVIYPQQKIYKTLQKALANACNSSLVDSSEQV